MRMTPLSFSFLSRDNSQQSTDNSQRTTDKGQQTTDNSRRTWLLQASEMLAGLQLLSECGQNSMTESNSQQIIVYSHTDISVLGCYY